MKYRVQFRDHLGVVDRAFGGRVVKHTSWKTEIGFVSGDIGRKVAIDYCSKRASVGLRQWRCSEKK